MNKPIVIGLFALGAVTYFPASASDLPKVNGYPERPITVISPYGPGGGSDIMARAWAGPMSEVTGTEFRVINQPGAGGFAAIPDYMARPADGYTILQHVNFVIEGQLLGRVDFNILDRLTPICTANVAYSQIYVRPYDDRFPDWDAFVAYVRANPGQVTVGNVNTEFAQIELLANALDLEFEQINFSLPAERYASVVGHHVDILYEQPGDVANFLRGNLIKPILTLVKGDPPDEFPDVPTLTDIGLDDLEVIFLTRMFLINSDVPRERIDYLEAACERAYNSDSFQQHLRDSNLDPEVSFLDSAGTRALLEEQLAAFKRFHGIE